MNKLALAVLASMLVAGCGFVDQDIHKSDEQLRAELMGKAGYGSGSIGMSGRGISSSCGINIYGGGHGHYHKRAHYHFDASHIALRLPPDARAAHTPPAIGGIEPVVLAEHEAPHEEPRPPAAPPRVETWGQLIEWHYEQAQRRGEIDQNTTAAVDAWRR